MPPYGEAQDVLDTYVTALMQSYSFRRFDDSNGNKKFPIMMERGAAIYSHLVNAIADMQLNLEGNQRGLVLITTHCPTIDAFAMTMDGRVTHEEEMFFTSKDRFDGYGARVITPGNPLSAHNMGQYVRGELSLDGGTFMIKGKEVPFDYRSLKDKAQNYQNAGSLFNLPLPSE